MYEMYGLLINNARIPGAAEPVDIGITGDRIAALGKLRGTKAKAIINADSNLVLSGFVNSHTHLDKANLLYRLDPGQFLGGTLEQNREFLKSLKRNYTLADIKHRAREVVKQMILQGVTAIRTQVDVDPSAKHTALHALVQLREELSGIVHLQICAFPQEGLASAQSRELFEQAMEQGADLVGGVPLVERTLDKSKKHIDFLFEIAKKYNRDLDVQVDESNNPDDFVLPYLTEKTILENYHGRVTATHCISLSAVPDEVAEKVIYQMRQARINVIVNPSCNLDTRFRTEKGVCFTASNSITRVQQLLEHGINVGIGTDNIRDIFWPLGNGSMLQEMHVLASATRMKDDRAVENIFGMATLNGARIMGLNYGVEVGKLADLVVLSVPSHRDALASAPFVCYVIRGGKIVATTEVRYNMPFSKAPKGLGAETKESEHANG